MSPDTMTLHFFVASALVLVTGHAAGWLARQLRQPYIVGQLTSGIALGPSLLGDVWPDAEKALFPGETTTALSYFAQFALVVFLFTVGYELDLKVLGARARTAATVALAAFVVPMAVGSGCALLFQDQLHALGMPRDLSTGMVVFAGVALSITAVPVLTAIVRENGLARTVPGIVAVSAAGLLDVIGWTVLAGALLDGDSSDQALGWPVRVLIAVGFVALMVLAARPLLRLFLRRTPMEPLMRVAVLLGFALGAAAVTHSIGLHAIFGALLAGAVTPREESGTLDPDLVKPLNDLSSLLLPFFFVVSGQSVALGSMGATGWTVLLVVTLLAVVTKVGSATAAARLTGLNRHESRTVGVLMSTRGLTELIALNAGLQAGLLSKPFYTVLVFMALATTLFTQPMLILVRRLAEREQHGREQVSTADSMAAGRLRAAPGDSSLAQHPQDGGPPSPVADVT